MEKQVRERPCRDKGTEAMVRTSLARAVRVQQRKAGAEVAREDGDGVRTTPHCDKSDCFPPQATGTREVASTWSREGVLDPGWRVPGQPPSMF